jgi:hypothetical protein
MLRRSIIKSIQINTLNLVGKISQPSSFGENPPIRREKARLFRLCRILFNIINILYSSDPSQEDADFVLSGMVLARGAANIAHQLFGWHPRGRGGGFWLIFTLLGVTMSQKSSVIRIASLVL